MGLQVLFPRGHVFICVVEAYIEESPTDLEAVTISQGVCELYVSSHFMEIAITRTKIEK